MGEYTVFCKWLPTNHWLFQMANVFLALSFLAVRGVEGLIYLRFVLGMAGVCFSLWGWLILCALDTCLWNAIFFVINFGLMTRLILIVRPVKFEWYHEIIYSTLFQPVGIKRYQYNPLRQGSKLHHIMVGEKYAHEGVTKSDQISVIISGSFDVIFDGKTLHSSHAFEFIDSPEWIISRKESAVFQITLQASENASYVSWNRHVLDKTLNNDPFLKSVFGSLIGEDLAKKVFKNNHAIVNSVGETQTGAIPLLYQGQCSHFCPNCSKEFEMSSF